VGNATKACLRDRIWLRIDFLALCGTKYSCLQKGKKSNKAKHEHIPIETKGYAIKVQMGNTSTREVGGWGHHV
jgi:hypothetical protein